MTRVKELPRDRDMFGEVSEVVVFGSMAYGAQTAASDLDVKLIIKE